MKLTGSRLLAVVANMTVSQTQAIWLASGVADSSPEHGWITICTGAEVLVAPELSVATAVRRFEPGELVWFVHPTHGAKHALALVRDHKTGAYVFGGHTGSHYTGHGEVWVQKLVEIQSLGYLWWRHARSQEIVPANWEPPDQEAKKDIIVARIQNGEL